MNRWQQTHLWLACCAVVHLPVFSMRAQDAAPPPMKLVSAPANILPPFSPPPSARTNSPVDFFRQLLAMTARERENFLTNKPPAFREHLLAKISEYQALDPNERELRLRATELRWYLIPFFHEPATNHAARLAQVPDGLRGLVGSRVNEWDSLPPQLQQEFLANERALHYFAHIDSTNNPPPPTDSGRHHGPTDEDQSRWNALSPEERGKIAGQFNQFFELTPAEKQKTLNTLSAAERRQMEATLQSFGKLPPPQRRECIRAFTEFAGMNPQERTEFLKNAERWSQMPPAERQAWRDLVADVPQWPPLPQSLDMPPLPPPSAPRVHHVVATNYN